MSVKCYSKCIFSFCCNLFSEALVVSQLHNHITLLIQPVRKFFRAGCSCFYSLFSQQRFFLEVSICSLNFFQTVIRKASGILSPVDFVPPVLALILIKQVIVIFSGSFVKLPLVLKCLRLAALAATQLIPLCAGCPETRGQAGYLRTVRLCNKGCQPESVSVSLSPYQSSWLRHEMPRSGCSFYP